MEFYSPMKLYHSYSNIRFNEQKENHSISAPHYNTATLCLVPVNMVCIYSRLLIFFALIMEVTDPMCISSITPTHSDSSSSLQTFSHSKVPLAHTSYHHPSQSSVLQDYQEQTFSHKSQKNNKTRFLFTHCSVICGSKF